MVVALALLMCVFQDPDPGISRELAASRSQRIEDVAYDLAFHIEERAEEVTGTAFITFRLPEDTAPGRAVVLDFDGSGLDDIRVNEVAAGSSVIREDNHLLVYPDALAAGLNSFSASFRSPVAPTGTPLTVYRDPADGKEYWYTLLVPADAHRLFPCFDQPDLKARLTLELDIPADWQAVSNGPEHDPPGAEPAERGRRKVFFRETRPISTYLMAFAAGPFAVTEDAASSGIGDDPRRRLRLFHRASRREDLEARTLFDMHRRALRWLTREFGVDYPFAKLDLVLVPGFPYGGMEHAGAIFYRERALVFDGPPTESELTRRSTLIYHELSHQWFGNLVTMEWFDDLWLKEGFATFIGYRCMNALEPEKRSWLRFHQRVKPRAYQVDATDGTVPVFQMLGNLADAKSTYGPIVYNKAPAVLRQLHEQLGERAFRQGLRTFLTRHAYGNARWQDLVTALEGAGRTRLERWSERWILTAGMPQVRLVWEDEDGEVTACTVDQHAVQGGEEEWPLELELLVWDHQGERSTISVRTDGARTPVPELVGRPVPECVLLNPRDVAYGQFLLDARSRDFLLGQIPGESDPLVRAVALSALYETVREVQMDPLRFAELVLELLPRERDAESHAWLLGALTTCLQRYLPRERAAPLRQRATDLLLGQLEEGMDGLELQSFRFLARIGSSGERLEELLGAVSGGEPPETLEPARRDRFLAAASLLARGHGREALDGLAQELRGEDVAKDIYLAEAATPTADAKERVFATYRQLGRPPEQWMQDSLGFFHWPGQQELTLPFLEPALEMAPWVKEHRKIFFMPAWIDAFVNGHSSPEALEIVEGILEDEDLAGDIRKKLLQSVDGLRRAVRIRARW